MDVSKEVVGLVNGLFTQCSLPNIAGPFAISPTVHRCRATACRRSSHQRITRSSICSSDMLRIVVTRRVTSYIQHVILPCTGWASLSVMALTRTLMIIFRKGCLRPGVVIFLVHFSGKGDAALILWLFIVVFKVLNLIIYDRCKNLMYAISNLRLGLSGIGPLTCEFVVR